MSEHEKNETKRSAWSRRVAWYVLPVLWMTLGALVVWTGNVASQPSTCGELPAPLTVFCPGTPARASEINDNFAGVAGWIAAKVGPVDSPNVTVTGNATFSGTVNVPDNSFTGADIANRTVAFDDLNPAVAGTGLTAGAAAIEVDSAWVRDRARDQVRSQLSLSREFELWYVGNEAMVEQVYNMTVPPDGMPGVPATNSMCFLTMSSSPDDNDEDDVSRCWVHQVLMGGAPIRWELHAVTNASDGWDHRCRARCLSW